ncbi:hypothetical protein [uncultured Campylobacter sp.]|uniref:hypothetical protein n=1 Tax=uncultured Campylobacter sp. TaxID=218934 RepID=UPI002621B507|nr:hypothetical protein [uncultured Campylobacter sp.]
MGGGIASVRVSKPKTIPPFALAMNTVCMKQQSKGEPNRCAGEIRGILPIVACDFI